MELGSPLGNLKKIRSFSQTFGFGKPDHQDGLLGSDGDGEPLSPLCTATLDDQAAIFSGHADEESVSSFP